MSYYHTSKCFFSSFSVLKRTEGASTVTTSYCGVLKQQWEHATFPAVKTKRLKDCFGHYTYLKGFSSFQLLVCLCWSHYLSHSRGISVQSGAEGYIIPRLPFAFTWYFQTGRVPLYNIWFPGSSGAPALAPVVLLCSFLLTLRGRKIYHLNTCTAANLQESEPETDASCDPNLPWLIILSTFFRSLRCHWATLQQC